MNRFLRSMNKKGYTLLEITAIVIIVGVSASFALVQYGDFMRRMRSQEGRQILIVLYGGQVQRLRDVGTYFGGTQAQMNAAPFPLNVTFPQLPRNFKNLTAEPGTARCNPPNPPVTTVGRIEANDDSYALHITDQGNIICTTVANGCPSALCQRIL